MPRILLFCLFPLLVVLGRGHPVLPSVWGEQGPALRIQPAGDCPVPGPRSEPTGRCVAALEPGGSEPRDAGNENESTDVPCPAPASVPGPAAELETLLEALEAEVTPVEIRMVLPSDATFGINQHVLRPEAGEFLKKAARVIRALPGRPVLVEGFTDFTGGQDYNRDLSLRRAESVRRWLVEQEGITETSLGVKGWGKSRPRASNRTEEGRRLNRRVEIVVRLEP